MALPRAAGSAILATMAALCAGTSTQASWVQAAGAAWCSGANAEGVRPAAWRALARAYRRSAGTAEAVTSEVLAAMAQRLSSVAPSQLPGALQLLGLALAAMPSDAGQLLAASASAAMPLLTGAAETDAVMAIGFLRAGAARTADVSSHVAPLVSSLCRSLTSGRSKVPLGAARERVANALRELAIGVALSGIAGLRSSQGTDVAPLAQQVLDCVVEAKSVETHAPVLEALIQAAAAWVYVGAPGTGLLGQASCAALWATAAHAGPGMAAAAVCQALGGFAIQALSATACAPVVLPVRVEVAEALAELAELWSALCVAAGAVQDGQTLPTAQAASALTAIASVVPAKWANITKAGAGLPSARLADAPKSVSSPAAVSTPAAAKAKTPGASKLSSSSGATKPAAAGSKAAKKAAALQAEAARLQAAMAAKKKASKGGAKPSQASASKASAASPAATPAATAAQSIADIDLPKALRLTSQYLRATDSDSQVLLSAALSRLLHAVASGAAAAQLATVTAPEAVLELLAGGFAADNANPFIALAESARAAEAEDTAAHAAFAAKGAAPKTKHGKPLQPPIVAAHAPVVPQTAAVDGLWQALVAALGGQGYVAQRLAAASLGAANAASSAIVVGSVAALLQSCAADSAVRTSAVVKAAKAHFGHEHTWAAARAGVADDESAGQWAHSRCPPAVIVGAGVQATAVAEYLEFADDEQALDSAAHAAQAKRRALQHTLQQLRAVPSLMSSPVMCAALLLLIHHPMVTGHGAALDMPAALAAQRLLQHFEQQVAAIEPGAVPTLLASASGLAAACPDMRTAAARALGTLSTMPAASSVAGSWWHDHALPALRVQLCDSTQQLLCVHEGFPGDLDSVAAAYAVLTAPEGAVAPPLAQASGASGSAAREETVEEYLASQKAAREAAAGVVAPGVALTMRRSHRVRVVAHAAYTRATSVLSVLQCAVQLSGRPDAPSAASLQALAAAQLVHGHPALQPWAAQLHHSALSVATSGAPAALASYATSSALASLSVVGAANLSAWRSALRAERKAARSRVSAAQTLAVAAAAAGKQSAAAAASQADVFGSEAAHKLRLLQAAASRWSATLPGFSASGSWIAGLHLVAEPLAAARDGSAALTADSAAGLLPAWPALSAVLAGVSTSPSACAPALACVHSVFQGCSAAQLGQPVLDDLLLATSVAAGEQPELVGPPTPAVAAAAAVCGSGAVSATELDVALHAALSSIADGSAQLGQPHAARAAQELLGCLPLSGLSTVAALADAELPLSAHAGTRLAALRAIAAALVTATSPAQGLFVSIGHLLWVCQFFDCSDSDSAAAQALAVALCNALDAAGLAPRPAMPVPLLAPYLGASAASVRGAAARALAAVLRVQQTDAGDVVHRLLAAHEQASSGVALLSADAWRARAGIMAVMGAAAGVQLPGEDAPRAALPVAALEPVLRAIVQRGLADAQPEAAASALSAGQCLVQCGELGGAQAEATVELLSGMLASLASSPTQPPAAPGALGLAPGLPSADARSPEEIKDAQRAGAVVLLGAAASHLPAADPRIDEVLQTLLDTLATPSESVQLAVTDVLPPLAKMRKGDAAAPYMRRILACAIAPTHAASFGTRAALLHGGARDAPTYTSIDAAGDDYGVRRGAAWGCAGFVKGAGLAALKGLDVMAQLQVALDSDVPAARVGALMCFETLSSKLGMLFEPYVIKLLPGLLAALGDIKVGVREAAMDAARCIMGKLTGHGVKLILPVLLSGVDTDNWRSKAAALTMLGSMAYCAPKQLSSALPKIVPALTESFLDTHPKVQAAGQSALEDVSRVIRSPEVSRLSDLLLAALVDPAKGTAPALDGLWRTSWSHALDPPALALIMPVVRRALTVHSAGVKRRACAVASQLPQLVTDTGFLAPYLPSLLPPLRRAVLDSIPDVRSTAASTVGSLVLATGEDMLEAAWQASTCAKDTPADSAEPGFLAWAMHVLGSNTSVVERSGAAAAAVEYLVAAGGTRLVDTLHQSLLPLAQAGKGDPEAACKREGVLWTLAFLPATMNARLGPDAFAPLIPLVFPLVVQGLADESDGVREVALRTGTVMVESNSATHAKELLAPMQAGLFASEWRVREACCQLLTTLTMSLTGRLASALPSAGNTNASAKPSAADDSDSCASSDASDSEEESPVEQLSVPSTGLGALDSRARALVRVLGPELRAVLTADAFIVQTGDSVQSVRQAAQRVWKEIAPHAPRTLRQVLPTLVKRLIELLAQPDEDLQGTASRALRDVARRLGDSLLPTVLPVLQAEMKAPSAARRQGVCLGLEAVLHAVSARDLDDHSTLVVSSVRTALCDVDSTVREAAAGAFNELARTIGERAIHAVVPALLATLDEEHAAAQANGAGVGADPLQNARALAGLQQVLAVRARDVLPMLVPRLVSAPITVFKFRALAAVAASAGEAMGAVVQRVVPPLVAALTGANDPGADHTDAGIAARLDGVQGECAARTIAGIGQSGASWLGTQFCAYLTANLDTREPWVGAHLLARWAAGTGVDVSDLTVPLLTELLARFSNCEHVPTVSAVVAALTALVTRVTPEGMLQHVGWVRDCLLSSASESRHRSRKGSSWTMPALGVKGGIDPLLAVATKALLAGDAAQRGAAAQILGEVIRYAPAPQLRPYIIKITGPLIRVAADKLPAASKAAILSTLVAVLGRGGPVLRPFLPQLSTSFVRALAEQSVEVRDVAATGLAAVAGLNPRVDPAVLELLAGLGQDAAAASTRASQADALVRVLRVAASKLTSPTRERVVQTLRELLAHTDEVLRRAASAGAAVLMLDDAVPEEEVAELTNIALDTGDAAGALISQVAAKLGEALGGAGTAQALVTHARVFMIRATFKHADPAQPRAAGLLDRMVSEGGVATVLAAATSSRVPVREAAASALGWLVDSHAVAAASVAVDRTAAALAKLVQDSVGDVRRAAAQSIASIVRRNPAALSPGAPATDPLLTVLATVVKDKVGGSVLRTELDMGVLSVLPSAAIAAWNGAGADALAEAARRASRRFTDETYVDEEAKYDYVVR